MKQHIFVLLMLCSGISAWAQYSEKEYFRKPVEKLTICTNAGTYTWKDHEIDNPGRYYDTLFMPYEWQADTIYTLDFKRGDNTEIWYNWQMPKGDSIRFRDVTFKEDGNYSLSYPGTPCDTIIHINIAYITKYEFFETQCFCGDTVFYWHGQRVDSKATKTEFKASYKSVQGFDSIYYLKVKFEAKKRDYHVTQYWCKQQIPYVWGAYKLYEECDTVQTFITECGCDSTVYLKLKLINQPPKTEVHIDGICGSTGYFTHGKQIYADTTITDIYPNWCGCDSVVDSIFTFIPETGIIEEFRQHSKIDQPSYPWHGKLYTEDGYYYDTAFNTNPLGCDTVYRLHLVTKFEVAKYRSLCIGDTAHYKWTGGDSIVTQNSDFKERYIATTGGDSVVTYHYEFTPKVTISAGEVTICGNETYTWQWGTAATEKIVISGKDYKNNGEIKRDSVFAKLPGGQCQQIRLYVNVIPYYLKDSTVIWCKDDPGEFVYIDHNKIPHRFNSLSPDKTVLYDTLNAPQYHSPSIQESFQPAQCDSIVRFTFINSNRCSNHETYYLCEGGKIKIGNQWYTKEGDYRVNLSPDSVHRFTIVKSITTTLPYDTLWLCESQIPYTYLGNTYTKTCDTIAHTPYAGQKCDSLIAYLHVEVIPNRRVDTTTYHFCSNQDIYVVTKTGKVLNSIGYFEDTLKGSWSYRNKVKCDSIFPYYITIDPAFYTLRYDSIKPYRTYHWTYQGRDSVITTSGIYVDSIRTVGGCDSINKLILNWNYPIMDSIYKVICDNQSFTWRGVKYYQETHIVDTIWSNKKDTIVKLDLMINPTYMSQKTVALIEGAEYNFYGHILTLADTNKVISESLPSSTTCDSIERIKIVPVQPTYHDTILCPNQYIIKDGDTIRDRYADTTCVEGSYSIRIFTITRASSIIYEQYKQLSPGDTYQWQTCSKGLLTITSAGTYLDSCRNQFGCDSIIRLKVVMTGPVYQSDTVNWCYRDLPYHWHGQEYYETGVFTYLDKTTMGQPRVDTLHLNVLQAVHKNVFIDTCDLGFPVRINGKDYHRNCAFVDTLTSYVTHCDSIVHYVLSFHTQVTKYEHHQIFEGETYLWRGQVCQLDSQYTDIGRAEDGCDTLFTLFLKVCPRMSVQKRTIEACQGDVVRVNGDTIFESKEVDEYHYTDNGCQYITRVNVIFHDKYLFTRTDSIYPGGTLHWRNKSYTIPGTYDDSLTTATYGCDSVYRLIWHFSQQSTRDTTILICRDSLPYQHKGAGFYFNDTTFTEYTYNDRGWISTYYKWHYRVTDRCSDYDVRYLCPNSSIEVHGIIIDQPGFYSVRCQTELGEDSLYRFKVLNAKAYKDTIAFEGCDSIVHGGRTFYYPGNDQPFYRDMQYTTIHGCDSLEHVKFTIHSSKHRVENVSIADFEVPYRYAGREFSETGKYPIQFYTQYNCDSIVTLALNVHTTINDTIYRVYCKGDAGGVDFMGKKYFPETRLVVDSVIWIENEPVRKTLVVDVNQPFTITSFDSQVDSVVCSAQYVQFFVKYNVKDPNTGAYPTHYRVLFAAGDLDAHPKDMTYEVKGKSVLPIEMDGQGKDVQPGYYTYQIFFSSEACGVSDTSFTGNVLVRYPAEIMEANWNNMVTLVNENYNGGNWTLIPPYAWQVWDYAHREKTSLVVPDNNVQPYIASDSLRENDIVVVTLRRDDYRRPIPSCPFVFHAVSTPSGKHPVIVYPTVANQSTEVHMETEAAGEYQMYNQTGNKCRRGTITEGTNTLSLPSAPGCYLLHVTLQDGTSTVERLIIY